MHIYLENGVTFSCESRQTYQFDFSVPVLQLVVCVLGLVKLSEVYITVEIKWGKK